MLGKEGVSTLAGYGASNLVYDKTNNQTLGMIAGILASTGSAKGLNMADAKLGWSNKGVKGNVDESVTEYRDQSGSKADVLAQNRANGNVVINEYKSSLTAPLTSNQKIAFPEIFESGATVVGKGKGIFSGGYQIPPGTKVTIIRPE